jgi:murein DD-endopeptidase MepM/ murein hydrolase activator NlpD
MKRLAAAFVVALALAGSAGADVFKVVPNTPAGQATLPSALAPNAPGTASFSVTPPVAPEQLSYAQLLSLWQRAGAAYGIPWQVLAAINKIESNFGRNMGPSSAGAIGWMQFMPSTWERWGVDANGDGVADPWNAEDAITAAARYLAASGGGTDISRAVFSYNHAQWYVDEVLQLARVFDSGGQQMTFTLDRLQVSLDHARRAVAKANRKLVAAQRVVRARWRLERSLRSRAARAPLLSDRLDLERRAAQAGVSLVRAQTRAGRARAVLSRARDALASAQDHSVASSFAPAAGTMLGAPTYDGSYVFPVGGGPSLVSVSHHHHDYPAADIDAPLGSPVYALANGIVVRAWRNPDPRCGIGMTIRTDDGQTWTYCHLSYLDPSVGTGTPLSAGAQVGLVGATGDATGPHLHLQLDPTTSYPQDQPWFRSFANVAFRWQDVAPIPTVSAGSPVFAVVPAATQEPVSGGSVILFTR